ncbi:MAG: hypothetical protein KGR18_00555 [Acidobacteria bacterium]|nr:hypothetical protein [Acidobacteriota bacterium]
MNETQSSTTSGRRAALLGDLRIVLIPWLVARGLVTLAYVAALAIADRVTPGHRPTALTDGLMAWDGTWYRDIAQHGYGSLPAEGLRFFPLYPLLGRLSDLLMPTTLALVLVANLCSLALLVVFLRLLRRERLDRATIDRSLWYLVLFPGAFVLVWAYAEALFLLAALVVFLAIRTRRWWWAAAAGFLAGLARPLGVFLAVPVAIELVRGWRGIDRAERLRGLVAVIAPVAGSGSYLLWVGTRFGDLWAPFTVQSDLRGETVDPVSRLWEGLSQLLGPDRLGDGLHVPFAIAFVVLLIVSFRRLPVSYGAFALCVLVASLAAENLNSLERYGLNAFPLVIALAVVGRDGRVAEVLRTLLAGGMVALATMAWMGAYVP